ncbi:MAG TPA: aldo/keto reductase [Thermoanaerobaculia bacterium]|nr:aldo/keto reductase [Thermoanaerobaculia bacterium]
MSAALIDGRATAPGTAGFAGRSASADPAHFRSAPQDLALSSIGLGTYLGGEDDPTDRGFEESIGIALGCGVNVFDTAVNYRGERSERAVGRAVAAAIAAGAAAREELFVSTKGGFLPYDSTDSRSPEVQARAAFFDTGILSAPDVAAGCHAMSPQFLGEMIERSRRNLGLATIDLYYLHNPETQLQAVSRQAFAGRLRRAIEVLEKAVEEGRIAAWGVATWDALRVPASHPAHLSVAEIAAAARDVAGDGHHFAAVQAPINLAMPQAIAYGSQPSRGRTVPLAAAAADAGLALFASASMLQGRLVGVDLPEEVDALFAGVPAGAQRALQLPRSAAGVTSALVGVSDPGHARDTFGLARVPPADPDAIGRLFSASA